MAARRLHVPPGLEIVFDRSVFRVVPWPRVLGIGAIARESGSEPLKLVSQIGGVLDPLSEAHRPVFRVTGLTKKNFPGNCRL